MDLFHYLEAYVFSMEEDRARTGLHQLVDGETESPPHDTPRVPRKRFVGRRAPAGKADKGTDTSATIEDSGAIQGKLLISVTRYLLTFALSSSAPTDSPCLEPDSSGHPR